MTPNSTGNSDLRDIRSACFDWSDSIEAREFGSILFGHGRHILAHVDGSMLLLGQIFNGPRELVKESRAGVHEAQSSGVCAAYDLAGTAADDKDEADFQFGEGIMHDPTREFQYIIEMHRIWLNLCCSPPGLRVKLHRQVSRWADTEQVQCPSRCFDATG